MVDARDPQRSFIGREWRALAFGFKVGAAFPLLFVVFYLVFQLHGDSSDLALAAGLALFFEGLVIFRVRPEGLFPRTLSYFAAVVAALSGVVVGGFPSLVLVYVVFFSGH